MKKTMKMIIFRKVKAFDQGWSSKISLSVIDIQLQQLQAKIKSNMRQKYHEYINGWIYAVEKKKIQPNSYFQRFQNKVTHLKSMQIDYDRSIVPVIIHKMLQYFTTEGVPSQQPSLLRQLNILLQIVQSLYNNLFINRQDVGQIVDHLKISDKQITPFLQSTIQQVDIRWESCIIFRMDVFWFIIAFKDVSISLLLKLYEKTINCELLKDNVRIHDYYKSLKRKLERNQQILERQKKKQLHRTTISSRQNERLMNSMFDIDISAISEKNQLDLSNLSLDFE